MSIHDPESQPQPQPQAESTEPRQRPIPNVYRDPAARSRIPSPTKGRFANPHEAGLMRPRVRLAETSGSGMPLGASIQTPVPDPLPERGSGIFFALNLAAAIIAVIFTIQIALKF